MLKSRVDAMNDPVVQVLSMARTGLYIDERKGLGKGDLELKRRCFKQYI